MPKITLSEVLEMPVAERILLVEAIWDSIAAIPEAVPLTDEQRADLDQRLDDFYSSPETSVPWEEVKRSIRKRA